MPRQSRIISPTGIYHIMLRGVNRQNIFNSEHDMNVFLKIMKKSKFACGFELYAYCLMPNHIHFLMKQNDKNLEIIFKQIAGCYAGWFNFKYERTGHLFQDRFKSEPVENESYLITVMRYIHRNPLKAGLCENQEDYRYSSYNDYLFQGQGIADTGFINSLIEKDEFIRLSEIDILDKCLDIEEKSRIGDNHAVEILCNIAGIKNISDIKFLPRNRLNYVIIKARELGIAARQINRVTGIERYAIEKAVINS